MTTGTKNEKAAPGVVGLTCENGSWWAEAPNGYVFYTMEGKTQPHMLLREADE